jgi:hypothetical protein
LISRDFSRFSAILRGSIKNISGVGNAGASQKITGLQLLDRREH